MKSQTASVTSSVNSLPDRARRKIFRRVIPYIFMLYIIAYLDRANVSFAKLQMAEDLGFSEAMYGFGAGIFFVGYLLLEIPGAIIVERWSARLWIARILITWGLCTVLVGFVHTPTQFYIARTLLGIAEGGFFPGILVYLTHWFIAQDRAKAVAGFTMAAPASLVIGAPISALILKMDTFGLAGWRWVFILEGLPAVIFGVITLFYLTDRPKQAKWLEPEERDWVSAQLEEEKNRKRAAGHFTIWQGLRQRNVLLLALACAFANIGIFGFVLWLPSVIHNDSGLSISLSTVFSALPFVLAMASIVFVGRSSDRTGKRKLHTMVPMILAAVFFMLSTLPGQPFPVRFVWLCLTGAAALSWGVSFWVLPSLILGESAAAASIGFINSINALANFLGPTIIGFLLSKGYSFSVAVAFMSVCFLIAASLIGAVRVRHGIAQI